MFKRRGGSRSFSHTMTPLPALPVAGSPSTSITITPTPSASCKKEEKDKGKQISPQKGDLGGNDKDNLKEKQDEEQTAPSATAVDAEDKGEAFTAGKANEYENDAGANYSKDFINTSNKKKLRPAFNSKSKSPRDFHKTVAGVVIVLAFAASAASSYFFSQPPFASRTSTRASQPKAPPELIPPSTSGRRKRFLFLSPSESPKQTQAPQAPPDIMLYTPEGPLILVHGQTIDTPFENARIYLHYYLVNALDWLIHPFFLQRPNRSSSPTLPSPATPTVPRPSSQPSSSPPCGLTPALHRRPKTFLLSLVGVAGTSLAGHATAGRAAQAAGHALVKQQAAHRHWMVGHRTLAFLGRNVDRVGGAVVAVGEVASSLAMAASGVGTTASGLGYRSAGQVVGSAQMVASGVGCTARSLGMLASSVGVRLSNSAARVAQASATASTMAAKRAWIARVVPAVGWLVVGMMATSVLVDWVWCVYTRE